MTEKMGPALKGGVLSGGIKAFCCWSGGKESALSFYRAARSGIDIAYLVNMASGDGKHSRTHGVSSGHIRTQSESMEVPIIQRKTSWQKYEDEFKKVVLSLRDEGMTMGIFGDIDLQQHRDWVERVCKETNIKPMLPLWEGKRKDLLGEFIKAGFKTIIVSTVSKLMGAEWLGREIDEKFIRDLESYDKDIDLCGEKGEYHTFVYDGPIFQKTVSFKSGNKTLRGDRWFLELD